KNMTVVGYLAAAAMVVFVGGQAANSAQGAAALGGVVSSQAEGKMEGVVVTARRDGANFDVSVVSDAEGRYRFPRTHLTPGTYTVTIRAAGYELAAPAKATVVSDQTA